MHSDVCMVEVFVEVCIVQMCDTYGPALMQLVQTQTERSQVTADVGHHPQLQ